MENNKLYLNASKYNMIRVHDELLKIAEAAGAKIVKEKYKTEKITFYNRSINEKIWKNDEIIAALEKHGKNADHLKKENIELHELYEKSAYTTYESKYCFGGLSFKFVLNGYLYDFSQDDNPFFPAYVRKIKLNDDNCSYNGIFCCDSDENHTYFYDSLFSIKASNEDIKKIAGALFDYMLNDVKTSVLYVEKEKKRVPNLYNSGYHYETIVKKDNKKTILEFA